MGLPLFHELCSRLHEEPSFGCECKAAPDCVAGPLFGEFVSPLVAPNVAMGWASGDGDLLAKGA